MATRTIARMFDSYAAAAAAVRHLEAAGFSRDDVSLVAGNAEGRHGAASDAAPRDADRDGIADRTESGAGTGAGIGAALGGGAGLAAVCDIVVASEDAVFGFTEAKLGILPAVISPFALAKIGRSAARELFLTAARFSAQRAREIGLVHAVVPEAGLDAAVDGYVRELISSAPGAIASAKRLIADVAGRPPIEVSGLTAETIAAHRVSAEGQAGMRSFLEKRRAPWLPDGD
jgi:hypothetical protein